MTEVHAKAQRRDRWVTWIVIAVFVVAMILGWAVKSAAENSTVDYAAEGVQLSYPKGWLRAKVEAPLLLHVQDQQATPAPSSLMLQRQPLSTGMGEGGLSAVQQALSLERGRQWVAYRVLESEEKVSIAGHEAKHVVFAYVETTPNPFLVTEPVVMLGEDYIIMAKDGSNAYVFTLTAAKENYEHVQDLLTDLVRSFQE
ncbi:MAG: hypothetical protein JXA37_04915 [Chloroflexia bacterium]|nr:hypothetical protein [Chloroflexia bacterium]